MNAIERTAQTIQLTELMSAVTRAWVNLEFVVTNSIKNTPEGITDARINLELLDRQVRKMRGLLRVRKEQENGKGRSVTPDGLGRWLRERGSIEIGDQESARSDARA